MKTISEIIQECCEGLDYKEQLSEDGYLLGVMVSIGDHICVNYFDVNGFKSRRDLEGSLSWELTRAIKVLKQQAHVFKRGDVIREYGYGTFVESTIISDVVINDRGQAVFVSETEDGDKINYMKHRESLEVQGL